jgi:hypothetical protein
MIYFIAIWNILLTFGIFYDHFVLLVFIWYIFPVLVSWTKKNLAALLPGRRWSCVRKRVLDKFKCIWLAPIFIVVEFQNKP